MRDEVSVPATVVAWLENRLGFERALTVPTGGYSPHDTDVVPVAGNHVSVDLNAGIADHHLRGRCLQVSRRSGKSGVDQTLHGLLCGCGPHLLGRRVVWVVGDALSPDGFGLRHQFPIGCVVQVGDIRVMSFLVSVEFITEAYFSEGVNFFTPRGVLSRPIVGDLKTFVLHWWMTLKWCFEGRNGCSGLAGMPWRLPNLTSIAMWTNP